MLVLSVVRCWRDLFKIGQIRGCLLGNVGVCRVKTGKIKSLACVVPLAVPAKASNANSLLGSLEMRPIATAD